MWLSSSSVGRKAIMAFSGAALLLFVTFHCLLNAIAICWPTTYNSVCMFLGANWYALIASVALAALIVIHIIYASVLTVKNRKARGEQRYAISKRPATVEWSSKNMMVLGIVILAFLVIHLIQFWAKMQLQEIRGAEEVIPPSAGTLFIQEAFSLVYTPIVYIIGFVALWFHLTHGFWSMFQSVGWDSTVWIPRLKKIGCWWVTLVCLCFTAQAIVFTVKANEGFYKTNPELRAQYKDMLVPMYERDFGPGAAQAGLQIQMTPYDQLASQFRQIVAQVGPQYDNDDLFEMQIASLPVDRQAEAREQRDSEKRMLHAYRNMVALFDYLEGKGSEPEQPAIQVLPATAVQPQ
ncbi:MAG: succinate dehydrogenase cytochrome b subunit [Muribaculaceae bacterium]|nr:succinate dehydrogenase cytochrome b subunit [Muribaculaceae bacterium]